VTVLIIGSGIVGVAIADALAARGTAVTVLDMRGPGRGASAASAGILAPYVESHHDARFLALATRSLALFDAFVSQASERSGRRIEYARTGTLEVALDDVDAARLQTSRDALAQSGIAHRWLSPADLRTAEPSVATEALGALLIEPHGFVGVGSLIAALVESARLSGASFEAPVEAVEVDPQSDRVEVRAGDSRYAADAVVIAAGCGSGMRRASTCDPYVVSCCICRGRPIDCPAASCGDHGVTPCRGRIARSSSARPSRRPGSTSGPRSPQSRN
jgi:glycine oxidase